jgi:Holliday junction resolvase
MARGRRNYAYGRRAEKRVAKRLQKSGWKTKLSPGSRGVDIIARKGPHKRYIQVKATRHPKKRIYVPPEQRATLKRVAARHKGKPMIAEVKRGKVDIRGL